MQSPTSALIYDQPIQHIKKQRHYFGNKCLSSQSYGFSSSQIWMWELDHKESWAPNIWCFQNVVLEKTLLDWKEIKAVNPKGNKSWIFIGRTHAEAEAPILWLPDVKSQLTEKDPDAGKDRVGKRRRKWQRWLDNITDSTGMNLMEDSGGQSRWACCSPWGCKELETT